MAKKGWEGALLKLYRAKDYTFTVQANEAVTDHFYRLRMSGGGLLRDHPVYPTMWARLWFEHPEGKIHQRGFTLVDTDAESDEFSVEFAIHDGLASRWATVAAEGDTIEATLYDGDAFGRGRGYVVPTGMSTFLIAGDTASLPAINSLLDELGDTPATVFVEWVHESDRSLPVHAREIDQVSWVERERDGEAIAEAVKQAAGEIDSPGEELFGWAACDTRTTRAIATTYRETYGIPKSQLKTVGYWQP